MWAIAFLYHARDCAVSKPVLRREYLITPTCGDADMARNIVSLSGPMLPKLFAPDPDAARRFIEFFTANIRNPNTRRAYARFEHLKRHTKNETFGLTAEV
jgi:hypothetical protein